MDIPDQVASYVRAGEEDGVMAPVYLYHCANICEVIRPGDTVLDLACGPANQLGMVARLNPDVHFVGMDLSEPMLERARGLVLKQDLQNVDFRSGDITDLSAFPSGSIDAVISTMALHHLPDQTALSKTFAEVARVLKRGGGLYLVDFGHLKAERSIRYFAYQYESRQPELFTLDYLNSLRAAFFIEDFRKAATSLEKHGKLCSTFLVPYMVVMKSPVRREPAPAIFNTISQMQDALPSWHKADLADLTSFFRFGGLRCKYLS